MITLKSAVIIKGNKYGISLILNQDLPFEELKEEIAKKFQECRKFFGSAQMAASFEGRKLSQQEEQEIIEIIEENSEITIICMLDSDTEKEERFRLSLEAKLKDNETIPQDGQFYKGTLRSGQVLEAESSIVILGDVNPGAKIISKGNVIVLGALKGTVFAGAAGKEEAFVVALEMQPTQIRIADFIARSSDERIKGKIKNKKLETEAKIAYVEEENIYIDVLNRDIMRYIN